MQLSRVKREQQLAAVFFQNEKCLETGELTFSHKHKCIHRSGISQKERRNLAVLNPDSQIQLTSQEHPSSWHPLQSIRSPWDLSDKASERSTCYFKGIHLRDKAEPGYQEVSGNRNTPGYPWGQSCQGKFQHTRQSGQFLPQNRQSFSNCEKWLTLHLWGKMLVSHLGCIPGFHTWI